MFQIVAICGVFVKCFSYWYLNDLTCAWESFLGWLLHKCSMDVLIMFCSNMLTHWTRVVTLCAVLWCYGCVQFPLPYAKCKVYEDMQVARCLCNFPLSPSE